MSRQYDRKLFIFFGVLFLLFSSFINWATISTGVFPAGHDVMLVAMTIMAFCNAYLSPQFIKNDERTKKIRERGMFFSYFFILGYMAIFMALLQFNIVHLSAFQAISLIAALTIITVFISFVVLSRRY